MSLQIFTLPDLGEGLTEAELIRWLVAVGDTIAIDAPIAEVETAKAAVEVPSPFGGVVAQLHGEEGTTIAVGAPLISVEDGAQHDAPLPDTAAGSYIEEERAGSGNVLIGYGTSASAPSRRRRSARATIAASSVPDAPAATSTAQPPPATPAAGGQQSLNGSSPRPAVSSPIVRQFARSRGLDLATIIGTGPNGLITRQDVQASTPAVGDSGTGSAATVPPITVLQDTKADNKAGSDAQAVGDGAVRQTGLPVRTRVPLRGLRKAVTDTLTRSRTEIPEATTWVDVDATALLDLRASWAADAAAGQGGEVPGVLAMVARFVVAGLARFPELNARVDTETQEILHLDGVNLGIAAQTDRGLVVPAVRGAHRLGMRGLHTEIKRLTAAARDGSATTAELTSGSFTLNNYGMLGVDGSAAIINHPEVAILGMGRIIPRPWVVDGEIVARRIGQLSLVFDHRVCDGGTAGGFLRFVADAIENPTAAMADL
jgi:2-oxoisovalerate dehydrogenase E2 component (dihydrolipoyl transacylase)